MINFSRRISELFDQLDSAHASHESEKIRESLLWLTTEANSQLELDLIAALDQRLSKIDVQREHAKTTASRQSSTWWRGCSPVRHCASP